MTSTTVMVTGAGGGIGAATIRELSRRSVNVVAVDVTPPDPDALREGSGEVIVHAADVSSGTEIAQSVALAQDRFGALHGIFNNAGIFGTWATTETYPEDMFERVFAVNVRGVQLGMKHAIPALRASGGGAIVNTASTGALGGVANAGPYVASKHAVLGLTRSAAIEVVDSGISVNALCPGPTDTAMMAEITEASGNPVHLMSVHEVAAVAVWLLLDAPKSLTGTHVTVSEGRFGS